MTHTSHRGMVCAVTALLVLSACGAAPDSTVVDGSTATQVTTSTTDSEETSTTDTDGTDSTTAEGGGQTGTDTDGGSTDEDGPEVVTSPLRVPLPINQLGGLPVEGGLEEVRTAIVEACGGQECITIVTVPEEPEPTDPGLDCKEFIRRARGMVLDPEDNFNPYVEVERGGSIVIDTYFGCREADDSDVVTSPLRIPLPIDELMGREYSSGLADLLGGIAFACGGEQCVSVEKVSDGSGIDDDGWDRCDTITEVVGTQLEDVPDEAGNFRPYVEVERGGTITVLVNAFCEDSPGDQSTSTDAGP